MTKEHTFIYNSKAKQEKHKDLLVPFEHRSISYSETSLQGSTICVYFGNKVNVLK